MVNPSRADTDLFALRFAQPRGEERDAHDREPVAVVAQLSELEPLTERRAASEVPIGEWLVDDRHAARSGAVVIREGTPALHLDFHGGEVTGVNGSAEHRRLFAALREPVAFGHNSYRGLRRR